MDGCAIAIGIGYDVWNRNGWMFRDCPVTRRASMKFEDDIEVVLEQDAVSEEQLEQFCKELQEILASDKVFGQLLLKSMSDAPFLDSDVADEDTQMALLLAAENPTGVLH